MRSRGTFLNTSTATEGQASPCVGAECFDWNGTQRELAAVVADVLANYPDVRSLCVFGGHDAADELPFAMDLGDESPGDLNAFVEQVGRAVISARGRGRGRGGEAQGRPTPHLVLFPPP